MKEETKGNKLWTKDFTILTLGSVVSIFGNVLAGFAMSLLVLDYTKSTIYYSIYLALYSFPAIFAPIIGGAILDRFSRKKTIYTLDFISSALYLLVGIIIVKGWFNFGVLALFTFTVGVIEGVYHVAYESLFPMLVSEGNFTKAYSVSAFLETVAAIMLPISTFLYKLVGVGPLLLVNTICFFTAACLETRIGKDEGYIETQRKSIEGEDIGRLKLLFRDLKEGGKYLYLEKGLLAVAVYFGFSAFASGAYNTIALPFFKETFTNGEYLFTIVMGVGTITRAIGGGIHYKNKLPVDKKYLIALVVYISISIIEGIYLYFPLWLMCILVGVEGMLGITSYTIRVSATQSYVPDEKKGRFNGVFDMISAVGMLAGELIAGVLCVFIPKRGVVSIVAGITCLAAVIIIGGNKKHIAPIYNRQE